MGLPILILTGVVAVAGGVAYYAYQQEKKRTAALKQLADELKFDFAPKGDEKLRADLGGFTLFSHGHAKKLTNLLRGTTPELDVAVFDYRYTVGGGHHRHTSRQTVVSFRFPGGRLPRFSLRPETVWHRIGSWLGYQDINFESHPVFSQKYLLRGKDEPAIRSLFTPDVLEQFEARTGLCVEGAADRLIVYRPGKRVDPEAIRSLMEEAFGILALFRR